MNWAATALVCIPAISVIIMLVYGLAITHKPITGAKEFKDLQLCFYKLFYRVGFVAFVVMIVLGVVLGR